MKILQLTVKPPFPPVDGGCIAIKNFSELILKGGHSLKILTLATHKHPFKPKLIPNDFKKQTDIEGIYVNTEVNVVDAFSSMVTMDSYNIQRFFSTDFDARLEEVLLGQRFDIIQLESLFMTVYVPTIRRNSNAKIILRSHNFEHSIWEQIAAREDSKIKRWYLKFLAKRLRKHELDVMDQVDGVIAISSSDEKRYHKLKSEIPISCIPFSIDLNNYIPKDFNNPYPRVFHIGAMDWQPNIDGINWFLSEVWNTIHPSYPKLELHLAGRRMEIDQFQGHDKSVQLIGEVDDAMEFMNQGDIMIVPLHTGSGIRIKILEGMAMGKAVISTPIGAEGIEATHGVEIMIAENAEEFKTALAELLANPERIKEMGEKARAFALENFDEHSLLQRYHSFTKQLQEHI